MRAFISNAWRTVKTAFIAAWNSIRPTKEARAGASWALALTVAWMAVVGAWNLKSGFGLLTDFGFAIAIAVLGIPLVALTAALLLAMLRKFPRLFTGFVIGCLVYVSLPWYQVGYWVSSVLLFVECALGATLATVLLGGLRTATRAKKVVTSIILVAAIAANVGIFSFFHSDGISSEMIKRQKNSANLPPVLPLPNPADRGPFAVKSLYYGAGDSLRRPEFASSAAIKTRTVDASPFFKDFSGWKARIRKLYWGFGMDKLPLNGHVWYPVGAGPFPLVLIVHGNHNMSESSDEGYAYLGELLASRGFIMASLDENFLNSGLFHDPPKQQAVRGWMLLEHLKLWHEWNAQPGNIFNGKVDFENVALAGHSRGGEAAATAALFNTLAYYPDDATIRFHYGFKIKSIVAIAPADGQYKPADQNRVLKDINYFTIQGSYDSDLTSFAGSRQFDHVEFSGNLPAFKSELYIYRANHGQFNTIWGRTDSGAPSNWFLNLRPLLNGDQQRQILKIYLSAFLEATLHNRNEYADLFRDYRSGRKWLPDTIYVNRYADELRQAVCRFDEDADVTTTTIPGGRISSQNLTVWREGRIPIRDGTRDYNGVILGWNWAGSKQPAKGKEPAYIINLPSTAPMNQNADTQLLFSIAVTDDNAPKPGARKKDDDEAADIGSETTDFSVEAANNEGAAVSVPVSRFATLQPPLTTQFTKWDRLDKMFFKNASEPVFQTVAIPLSAFSSVDARVKAANISRIRLVFDKTPTRVIVISFIGFERAR